MKYIFDNVNIHCFRHLLLLKFRSSNQKPKVVLMSHRNKLDERTADIRGYCWSMCTKGKHHWALKRNVCIFFNIGWSKLFPIRRPISSILWRQQSSHHCIRLKRDVVYRTTCSSFVMSEKNTTALRNSFFFQIEILHFSVMWLIKYELNDSCNVVYVKKYETLITMTVLKNLRPLERAGSFTSMHYVGV